MMNCSVKLFDFQEEVLKLTEDKNKVAYYLDMGLGKTFVGAEKLVRLNESVNLVVCQKAKIDDWMKHFNSYYNLEVFNMANKKQYEEFFSYEGKKVGVINYDLLIYRRELTKRLKDFTLLCDESSMIQNENAGRTKIVLHLRYKNIILLSGTPTGGKYERLWSQSKMLGWDINKGDYWDKFVRYRVDDNYGFPVKIILGYKNVDLLKSTLRSFGAVFIKTEEVFDLPEQRFIPIAVKNIPQYKTFRKDKIVKFKGKEIVGDTVLNQMLAERRLCGSLNHYKGEVFKTLLEATDDRLVVFYSLDEELRTIEDACIELKRPVSIINGKTKDLMCYEDYSDSVTIVQYQAGAMGLNLQLANKIIYFTPPLSSELYEQSKKRIHRIGQKKNCIYYQLICDGSIENKIYDNLAVRKDYTDRLFQEEN